MGLAQAGALIPVDEMQMPEMYLCSGDRDDRRTGKVERHPLYASLPMNCVQDYSLGCILETPSRSELS